MCLVSYSKTKEYSSKDKFYAWDKKSPVWAYVELTDYCSHTCAWCYGDFPSGTDKLLPLENYRNILTKLKQMGIKQLSIGGGEPTEHPQFDEILSITKEFSFSNIHLLTHGDHIDEPMIERLVEAGVRSVHFNYQGSQHHDNIHGSAYGKQFDAILKTVNSPLEATATVTVGSYNLKSIPEIVEEVAEIGFSRVRFWETTGVGSAFLKGVEVKGLFDVCATEAKKHGYIYSHSYDPQYKEADINVPCIQASNLGMYVDYQGMVKYCGCTKEDKFIISILENTAEKIVKTYIDYNSDYSNNNCEARNPQSSLMVANL